MQPCFFCKLFRPLVNKTVKGFCVVAQYFKSFLSKFGLQWSKFEMPLGIMVNDKVDCAVAKITNPIKEYNLLFCYRIIFTQFLNSCFRLEGSNVSKVTVAV